jgi:ABC-type arginine transport system ATPase subunit
MIEIDDEHAICNRPQFAVSTGAVMCKLIGIDFPLAVKIDEVFLPLVAKKGRVTRQFGVLPHIETDAKKIAMLRDFLKASTDKDVYRVIEKLMKTQTLNQIADNFKEHMHSKQNPKWIKDNENTM